MKNYQTFTPVPGKPVQYLLSMTEMLHWINQSNYPGRIEFTDWAKQKYNAGSNEVSGYYQTLLKFGVVQQRPGRGLRLTQIGQALLAVPVDEQAALAFDQIQRSYTGFLDVLELFAESEEAVSISDAMKTLQPKYPQWKTKEPVRERIDWLLALKCLQRTNLPRRYQITDFGREAYSRLVGDAFNPDLIGTENDGETNLDVLIRELKAASVDIENPKRLRVATGLAFNFLGFEVDIMSGSDEMDVIASARMGSESYCVVVSTQQQLNKPLQPIKPETLDQFQQKYEEMYLVAVTQDVISSDLVQQAENQYRILTTETIVEWLRLHDQIPLDLGKQRLMFTASGRTEENLDFLRSFRDRRTRSYRLMFDILSTMKAATQRIHSSYSSEQLFDDLAEHAGDMQYTVKEVKQMLDFLVHPLIGAVYLKQNKDLLLLLNETTFINRMMSIANSKATLKQMESDD